jgi:uncharacterized membrane protein
MPKVQDHLRKTFLSGLFVAIPIGITAWILILVEARTRDVAKETLHVSFPFVGIILTILLVYLAGLMVTSLVGQLLISQIDRVLSRLPVLRELYRAWKQVSFTPTGSGGIFANVVLISDETGRFWMMGFSTAQPIPNDPNTTAVFVPAAPNPTSGRIYFVRRDQCTILKMHADEAFKLILSGGTYVPNAIGEATLGFTSMPVKEAAAPSA